MTGRESKAEPVPHPMWGGDRASQMLGMELVEATTGRAVVRMTIRDDMVNGLGVCHGGLIFALADSAMAFASNGPDRSAVSNHAEIDWLAPGRAGMVLTATCTTRHQRGKAGVHDTEVVDQDGNTVALFRGRTVQISRP